MTIKKYTLTYTHDGVEAECDGHTLKTEQVVTTTLGGREQPVTIVLFGQNKMRALVQDAEGDRTWVWIQDLH